MKLAHEHRPAAGTSCREQVNRWTSALAVCAMLLLFALPSASMRAQSTDPAELRRIMDQKNAAAAEATWGDWKPLPPIAPPSAPMAPAQGSSSSSRSDAGTSSVPTNLGLGSMVADPGAGDGTPAVQLSNTQSADPVLASGNAPVDAGSTPYSSPETDGTIAADSKPVAADRQPSSQAGEAKVTYKSGLLSVQANDSSLSQILSRIAALTGMKIRGSVADERVFGSYGPTKAANILSILLEGTGSNMLLVEGPHATVRELTLTARTRMGVLASDASDVSVNPLLSNGTAR